MGDFQANFERPKDSGIRTVEGNVAGGRAAALEKKRLQDQEEYERKKQKIHNEHARANALINKFSGGTTSQVETTFQQATVGLVTANQFRALQDAKNNKIIDSTTEHEEKVEETEEERIKREKAEKKAKKKRLKEKKKQLSTLSFANEEDLEIEDDDDNNNTNNNKKDPTIDTSFLPDKQREIQKQLDRKKLEIEWHKQQENIKNEILEIIYSYWDGSGHRRTITCSKGTTIGEFLELVRKQLCIEFRELTSISSDGLLYIKEDLIIPHDISFYNLIITKARGKSGPLFHFDIHDDVRIGLIDTRIEKDESHPGKVVLRTWYERNKHIFPASRWELYDPKKETYGTYTIGGKIVNNK